MFVTAWVFFSFLWFVTSIIESPHVCSNHCKRKTKIKHPSVLVGNIRRLSYSHCVPHPFLAHLTNVPVRRIGKGAKWTGLGGRLVPFAFGACTSVSREACVGCCCPQQGSAETFFLLPTFSRTAIRTILEVIFVLSFLPEVEGIVHQNTQGFDREGVVLQLLTLVKQPLADRRNLE